MNKSELSVVISAPSGAGKTTIIQKLLNQDNDLAFVVSTTTRKKRESEIESASYYFIEKDHFKLKISNNDFAEWACVHGNYYGTTKKEIDRIKSAGKIPLFDVDVQGACNFKRYLTDAIYIFIIPPSLEILEERLKNRQTDTEDQIKVRFAGALQEISEHQNYDYIVINDDLETAVNDIRSIIRTELLKQKRMKNIIEQIMEECGDNTIK